METQDDRRIPITPGLQGRDTNLFVPRPGEQDTRDLNDTSFQDITDSSQATFFNTLTSTLQNTEDISQVSPTLVRDLLARFQQQQQLIDMLLQQQQAQSSPQQTQQPTKKIPDYYNIAKYEDIICRGIKPPYDGTPDQLIPFLNRLDIRRQDESWYPSTIFILDDKTFDLTRHFAKVSEEDITNAAKQRWSSPSVAIDKITLDNPTYNARVLGRLMY
jgi:hypothetical protein